MPERRPMAHAATHESETSPCKSLRKTNRHGCDRTTYALTSGAWRRSPPPITLGNRIPAGMTSTAMIALAAKRRRTGFALAIQSAGRPARRSHASVMRLSVRHRFPIFRPLIPASATPITGMFQCETQLENTFFPDDVVRGSSYEINIAAPIDQTCTARQPGK